MEEEIARAERQHTMLSCLLVSIENLKAIEQAHGKLLAQQAVAYIGLALRRELRRYDRVGPTNEHDYLVVLPGVDGARGEIVARRALARLHSIKVEDQDGYMVLSVIAGIATWREGQTAQELLAQATAAAGRRTQQSSALVLVSMPSRFNTQPSPTFLLIAAGGSTRAHPMLSGSELWLLRLMADRGLALLDAGTLLIVIEERGELRMAASSGVGIPGVRILSVEGSALGALYRAGQPVALDRPRGQEALWLHELGIEARGVLVEPLSMEGHGGGLVIALRHDASFRGPDRRALHAFAESVTQRLKAERSVEIERLRYGMEARERERTRWAQRDPRRDRAGTWARCA